MHRKNTPAQIRFQNKSKHTKRYLVIFAILVALIYLVTVLLWKIPPITASSNFEIATPNNNNSVLTPTGGSYSANIKGIGVVASNNPDLARPIASISKVITALVVLNAKPINNDSAGPMITLTTQDNDFYNHYIALNGSVAPAPLGLNITEHDALTAMLLPSANNYADTLVNWAFGSQENYTKQANQFLRKNNLTNTQVADASGFSPNTKSSANDLLKLGQIILDNPILSKIAATKSTTINGLGELKNTNFLLNSPGVIGIKTGNTDEAKKCLLFAGKFNINNQDITIIGTILGQDTHKELFVDSQNLLDSVRQGISVTSAVKKDQKIATYKTPWGKTTNILASDDISVVAWQNLKPKFNLDIKPYISNTDNPNVGSLTIDSADQKLSTNLKLSDKISGPSYIWRITHPQTVFGFNK